MGRTVGDRDDVGCSDVGMAVKKGVGRDEEGGSVDGHPVGKDVGDPKGWKVVAYAVGEDFGVSEGNAVVGANVGTAEGSPVEGFSVDRWDGESEGN